MDPKEFASSDIAHIGKVKKFYMKRGYGFITRLSDSKEYFVHRGLIKLQPTTTYVPKLYDGEYVSFTVDIDDENAKKNDSSKLPRAKEVYGVNGWPLRVDDMCERQKQKLEKLNQTESKSSPPPVVDSKAS